MRNFALKRFEYVQSNPNIKKLIILDEEKEVCLIDDFINNLHNNNQISLNNVINTMDKYTPNSMLPKKKFGIIFPNINGCQKVEFKHEQLRIYCIKPDNNQDIIVVIGGILKDNQIKDINKFNNIAIEYMNYWRTQNE